MVLRPNQRPSGVAAYSPVGRCIYCGTTDGRLTKERIVAKAIGGTATLPKASCDECSRLTQTIEMRCFAQSAKSFRQLSGFKVKEAKHRPVHIRQRDRSYFQEGGGVNDPGILALPVYPLPSLLTDEAPAGEVGLWGYVANPHAVQHHAEGSGVGGIPFLETDFARMLAKVAHSFAAAEKGFEDFDPVLTDFIRGRDLSPSNKFVGCGPSQPPSQHLHQLEMLVSNHQRPYLVTHLRLFGPWGSPDYFVVTGISRTLQ